jgi:fatty acid desaturase
VSHYSISPYAREIRPLLRPGAFAPALSRLLWLPVHLTVIGLLTTVLAQHLVSWWLAPLLSLVIGVSFGGLTFLGHETLHGAVVRERRVRRLVGFLGSLPFVISPRLWIAWHNQVHHGNTNRSGVDPDAYPTLDEYDQNRSVRIAIEYGAPGRGRLRGALGLLIGFTVQSTHMLFVAGKRGYLSPREHNWAIAETLFGIALWSGLLFVIGPLPFLFSFGLPLVVANAIVMAFILTNHSLSPLTDVNDALANSLSVTTPRFVEWLTLGFGFHVEHHIFAAMSTRHAPEVRDVLRARFPGQYQSMPLSRALLALHHSARVYKDATTLIDPPTGREWPALAARAVSHPPGPVRDGFPVPDLRALNAARVAAP